MGVKKDNQPGSGIKFDEGKVRMDLLPSEGLFAIATILTVGALKYAGS